MKIVYLCLDVVCCVWVVFQRLCSSLAFVSVTDVVDNNDMDDDAVDDDDDDGCCIVFQFSSVVHFSLETIEEGKLFVGFIQMDQFELRIGFYSDGWIMGA